MFSDDCIGQVEETIRVMQKNIDQYKQEPKPRFATIFHMNMAVSSKNLACLLEAYFYALRRESGERI